MEGDEEPADFVVFSVRRAPSSPFSRALRWGSFYSPRGGWGYACCQATEKHAPPCRPIDEPRERLGMTPRVYQVVKPSVNTIKKEHKPS